MKFTALDSLDSHIFCLTEKNEMLYREEEERRESVRRSLNVVACQFAVLASFLIQRLFLTTLVFPFLPPTHMMTFGRAVNFSHNCIQIPAFGLKTFHLVVG